MDFAAAFLIGSVGLGVFLIYLALRPAHGGKGKARQTQPVVPQKAVTRQHSGEDFRQPELPPLRSVSRGEQESYVDPQQAKLMRQLQHFVYTVAEHYKLPVLPVAVTQTLALIQKESLDLREICRVLSTDVALASRVLSMARSPIYNLRQSPNTLQQALKVLGMQELRRILLTAGTLPLYAGPSEAARAAWRHSLTTALACQVLADRNRHIDNDQAFIVGLLHDVGSLVLLHSNRAQFDKMWNLSRKKRGVSVDWEREFFPRDHAWVGASVLYRWHMDTEMLMAVLSHHDGLGMQQPESLLALLKVGEWIATRLGAGFILEPITPTEEVRAYYGCETEKEVENITSRVAKIFEEQRNALEGKHAA